MSKANKTVKAADLMKRMIRVTIPKAPMGQPQSVFVGLNQKTYLIPRGREVEIPQPVWAIVRMSLRAEQLLEAELREN